jgi:hypothetical protein
MKISGDFALRVMCDRLRGFMYYCLCLSSIRSWKMYLCFALTASYCDAGNEASGVGLET